MNQNFRYPIDKWKLTWTRFDGVKRDITKIYLEGGFLRVSATSTDFTLITFGQ